VFTENGSKVGVAPVLLGSADGASGLDCGKLAKEAGGTGNLALPRPNAESTSAGTSEDMCGEEPNGITREQVLLQDTAVEPTMLCSCMPLCGTSR